MRWAFFFCLVAQDTPRTRAPKLLLRCCILIAFIGCENTTGTTTNGVTYAGPFAVAFAPSVSYEQALRLITDLGLQPSLDCVISGSMLTPGQEASPQPRWQPMGQRDTFLQEHQLRFISTLSSPADWSKRLTAISGVVKVSSPGVIYCPEVVYGTPPSGVAVPLNASQAGTYARITFAHPVDTYDTALYMVSNLGLQLADYCYEQATSKPPWHAVGQEQTFTTTHALTVETSKRITSSLWQDQLHTLPGVVTIESPFTMKC